MLHHAQKIVGTALVVLLLAIAAIFAGSGGAAAGTSTHAAVHRGGNLVLAHSITIKTMDPAAAVETETIYPIDMIYETLFSTRHNGQGVQPWLAKSFTLSKNKLKWTIKLRPGVKFSNGKPLTSADVKFSIDRNTKSGSFSFINSAIKSVATPNKSTVVIKTKYPWSPLPADLALWGNAILPKNFGGESATAFFKHPIGTGPFKFSKWVPASTFKVVRNPHYWQKGKPYLNSVTWPIVPDDSTRIAEVKGGQAQIAANLSFSELQSINSSSVKTKIFPSTLETYLLMNEKVKPFQDVHVRRAIAYAINRKAIVHAVLFGHGKPACSFMAPTLAYNARNLKCVAFNLTAAKAELAKSSVPHGFSTTILAGSGDVYNDAIAQIIQQNLAALKIKVTLDLVDPGQVYPQISKLNYQMAMEGWSSDIPDPDEQVSFMCDPKGGGADSYSTSYTNAKVIHWTRSAARTFNAKKRAAYYRKIQVQVNKDEPWVSLDFAPTPFLVSSKVHGFFSYPTGNYHLQDVWLSK